MFLIITQGVALGIYTMGARRLPAAQATLLGSAEMPMGPLWVWLFFNEMPATETFAGGALVLAAILGTLPSSCGPDQLQRPLNREIR
ncbi:MAG: hypothetical protein EOQ28_32820 [Mesorhizobium sp.]|uniref:hypothetical protein n=1 Tax=Mesorhizobium sp. TaxID=1871066 RepID=UPI000FE9F55F|nr:hypothetical protein [Mesorhizobium sp.]RWA59747.1 MAG: hypothetical protein EOQ28_32820 [Mesorhizobium sp.]RWB93444.1 MAG: hypothetical protein EOQ57_34225 [Mesorhizobium sp.]RWK08213.1 MAG: hypothetical protein EOR39_20165 [Mesorhizobium sp.]